MTVKKDGKVIATADLGTVAIDEGDTTITVDVLAPDFVATKTYTVMINRASSKCIRRRQAEFIESERRYVDACL